MKTTDMSFAERLLGRRLSPEAQGSVPTLNDVSGELLAEARWLANEGLLAAIGYLNFHLAGGPINETWDFCNDVLLGGADPATWGTQDLLIYYDIEGDELRRFRVADLVTTLEPVSGERWWRRVENGSSHWIGNGAPSVWVRAARYWWRSPPRTCSVVVDGPAEAIDDKDLPIAARRWLASRFAWEAREYLLTGAPTAEGLFRALQVERDQLSEDALIAILALVREANLNAEVAPRKLGFRGPDAWYSI